MSSSAIGSVFESVSQAGWECTILGAYSEVYLGAS